MYESEYTICRNVWDAAAKAVLRRKLIAVNAYIDEEEIPQVNNLVR